MKEWVEKNKTSTKKKNHVQKENENWEIGREKSERDRKSKERRWIVLFFIWQNVFFIQQAKSEIYSCMLLAKTHIRKIPTDE